MERPAIHSYADARRCGHCKKLEGPWSELGATFLNEDGILIAHIDADQAKNKEIASKLGVQGFPTIKFFENGKLANPTDYNGGRSAADLISYVNTKAGTHRKAGGLLDTMAGRLPDFDALVKRFVGAPTATRPDLLASASALASKLNGTVSDSTAAAAYYVRVLQKMATGNAEDARKYVETESARLQKMAGRKGSLAGKKRAWQSTPAKLISASRRAPAQAEHPRGVQLGAELGLGRGQCGGGRGVGCVRCGGGSGSGRV